MPRYDELFKDDGLRFRQAEVIEQGLRTAPRSKEAARHKARRGLCETLSLLWIAKVKELGDGAKALEAMKKEFGADTASGQAFLCQIISQQFTGSNALQQVNSDIDAARAAAAAASPPPAAAAAASVATLASIASPAAPASVAPPPTPAAAAVHTGYIDDATKLTMKLQTFSGNNAEDRNVKRDATLCPEPKLVSGWIEQKQKEGQGTLFVEIFRQYYADPEQREGHSIAIEFNAETQQYDLFDSNRGVASIHPDDLCEGAAAMLEHYGTEAVVIYTVE
jgi:hypothetical protein